MENFITLPDDVKIGIAAVVLAAFGFVVQFLIVRVPLLAKFVAAYKEEWSLTLTALLVSWLENSIPTGFDEVAALTLKLLLALFALVGFIRKFATARNVKGFKV